MNNTSKVPGRGKTRLIWLIATALTTAVLVFFVVQPVSAQGKPDDSRRYTLLLQNVFDFVQDHYVEEIDPQKLYEGAMKGLFEALEDPHSVFLTESDMSDLNDTTQGSFGGVGLYISKQSVPPDSDRPSYVEVASPIEDTPGWRAGISPGDLIIAIDGESTAAFTMDEVLARLRGIPGTDVTIMIRRGEGLEFPVTLTRAIIEVPTTKSAMIGKDIGYLRITTFTPNTVERAKDAIQEFKRQGYKSLIIDLRYNYGGLLQSAVGISELMLDGGLVVSTKSRIPEENKIFNANRGVLVSNDIPVVVLINKGSASASEIVAGALKDRGRAYLVGEKSYGKGSVQQVYPLGTTGFKMTTSRYFTPSDVNIDKIGIPPDLEVALPELSDSEIEGLNKLLSHERIKNFVKSNPNASTSRINSFISELISTYSLEEKLLRRLVRDEQNRTEIAPVYDLEYDIQLQKAVEILRNGSVQTLLRSALTLKQLQEQAASVQAKQEVTEAPTN